MLLHDLIEFFLGNQVPDLGHGADNVVLGDISGPVGVKLVEYCLQFVVV